MTFPFFSLQRVGFRVNKGYYGDWAFNVAIHKVMRRVDHNGHRKKNVLLAIISDIHANYEALTAIHQDIKSRGCDRVICLGDVVGYGAAPKECLDLVMESGMTCLRGNHDTYVTELGGDWKIQPFAKTVIRWLQDTLESHYIDWLRRLPFQESFDQFAFAHASLDANDGHYWPYILNTDRAHLHFYLQETRFCFYGHTHIPLLFSNTDKTLTMNYLRDQTFEREEGYKYLINCGSVGQPRDYDKRACYVLFDTETYELKLIRQDYDVQKAQRRILDAGLPELLAERLSHGL